MILDTANAFACATMAARRLAGRSTRMFLIFDFGQFWSFSIRSRMSKIDVYRRVGSKSQHPRARNDYDEETAYESYMNPEPGFQSGPGDSVDAD